MDIELTYFMCISDVYLYLVHLAPSWSLPYCFLLNLGILFIFILLFYLFSLIIELNEMPWYLVHTFMVLREVKHDSGHQSVSISIIL